MIQGRFQTVSAVSVAGRYDSIRPDFGQFFLYQKVWTKPWINIFFSIVCKAIWTFFSFDSFWTIKNSLIILNWHMPSWLLGLGTKGYWRVQNKMSTITSLFKAFILSRFSAFYYTNTLVFNSKRKRKSKRKHSQPVILKL